MSVIWDVDTIREIQQYYTDTMIADETIVSPGFNEDLALEVYREEYRRHVLDHCNIYVRHGIHCATRRPDFPSQQWGVTLRLSWMPLTKDVEFINGPIRGSCQALQKVEFNGHHTVAIPPAPSPRQSYEVDLSLNKVVYGFYGWNDSTGRWVYITDPR